MSVAGNIRFYREKAGLSQKELAAKMPVDVSWISYWEDSAGEPRLADIVRLSEVLGITTDDLLKERQEELPQLQEEYAFTYTRRDVQKVLRRSFWLNGFRGRIALAVFAMLCFVEICTSQSLEVLWVFAIVLAAVVVIRLIRFFFVRLKWKKAMPRIVQNIYGYRVYDDYFELTAKGTQEEITVRGELRKIEHMYVMRDYLLMYIDGNVWILRRDRLQEDSDFLRFAKLYPKKTIGGKKKILITGIELLGLFFFIGTIASIFLALIGIALLSEKNHMFIGNMWMMLVVTPIPIIGLILGYVLKKKKLRYRRNLIAAYIVLPILLIYGCMSFLFPENHSTEPLLLAEQVLQMDFPQEELVQTMAEAEDTTVYFNEADIPAIGQMVQADQRWVTGTSPDMRPYVSAWAAQGSYSCLVIVNLDTGEYNTLPKEAGTYRMLEVLYQPALAQMTIVQYDLEYGTADENEG